MTTHIYNDEALTRYLLGSLPEVEIERFDELSVTDDEFAELLRVAERDLVDAYVQGELGGDDLKRIRTHYLASRLRRDKVEFAQALQGWAEKNVAARAAEVKPEELAEKHTGWFSRRSVFMAPRTAWQWGMAAAALALFVVVGWLGLYNVRLRQQLSKTQAKHETLLQRERELQKEVEAQRSSNATTDLELARVRDERERLEQQLKGAQVASPPVKGGVVSLILAPPMRGVSQIRTVAVPLGTSLVAAQLQLEAADYSAYRVALIDPANNQTLWRSGNLKPRTGNRKVIGLSFPATLLKPQNYVLRVTGIPAGGGAEVVGDYSFRAVK